MYNQGGYPTKTIIVFYLLACVVCALILGSESKMEYNAVVASMAALFIPHQKNKHYWVLAALAGFLCCQLIYQSFPPTFVGASSQWIPLISLSTLLIPLFFIDRHYQLKLQQQDVQVRQIEAALHQTQQILATKLQMVELAADKLPAGVVYLDTKLKIRFHNLHSRCWFGSKQNVDNKSLAGIISAKRFEQFEQSFAKAEQDKKMVQFEEQINKENGINCFCRISLIPLLDHTKKLVGYFLYLEDVTNQRKSELAVEVINQELEIEAEEKQQALSALGKSEQRYRSLFENNGLGVLTIGRDGKITNINKAFVTQLGYTEEELIQITIDEIMVEKEALQFRTLLYKLAQHDMTTFNIEQKFITRNGSLLDVSVSITALYDGQENFQEAVAVVKDITEQKNTQEKLIAVNNELQQFASVASHDMKEPLRTISSFSALLARRMEENPSNKEFLDFIQDAAKRMTILLEDLITYARAGIEMQQTKTIDLNDVLLAVQNNLYSKIEQTDAQISCDTLPSIKGHFTPFVQLFQNILANAIKFQQADITPNIRISASALHDEFLISIADNGIGMDKAHINQIFEPFRRLHSRIEFEGSGIGLATCKKIIEQYKGDIWVESEKGKGTTFYITLPLEMIVEQKKTKPVDIPMA